MSSAVEMGDAAALSRVARRPLVLSEHGAVSGTVRRPTHPSGRTQCGAAAGCSATKYEFLQEEHGPTTLPPGEQRPVIDCQIDGGQAHANEVLAEGESVEKALQQRLEESGGALEGTRLQILELEQQVRLPTPKPSARPLMLDLGMKFMILYS